MNAPFPLLKARIPAMPPCALSTRCGNWLRRTWPWGVIVLGLLGRTSLAAWKWVNFIGRLGDYSYTLCVIHMPILAFFCGWLMSRNPDGHLPISPVWVLPGVALCVVVAWMAHFIVEKPFVDNRKKKAGAWA